jgi:hypothetical protein
MLQRDSTPPPRPISKRDVAAALSAAQAHVARLGARLRAARGQLRHNRVADALELVEMVRREFTVTMKRKRPDSGMSRAGRERF